MALAMCSALVFVVLLSAGVSQIRAHDIDGLYYNEELLPFMPLTLVGVLPSLNRAARSTSNETMTTIAPTSTSSADPTTQTTSVSQYGKDVTGTISVIAVEVQLPRLRARFYTKPKPCCGETFDEVGKLLLSDETAHQECIKGIFNGTSKYVKNNTETLPTLEDMRNRVVCVHQCVAENRSVADTNGTLSAESLKKYFTKNLAQGWSSDIIEKAVDTCMAAKGELAGVHCNPAAANMNRCLWRELMLNCPGEKVKKSPRCDLVMQRLKNSRN